MYTDAGLGSAVLLLALSAAFDIVDYPILLRMLETSVGVSGTALCWFTSYLGRKTQSVKVGNVISAPLSLLYGVPQDSVLLPSFFSVYTVPVPAIAVRRGIVRHLFSDDKQNRVRFTLEQRIQEDALNSLAAETADWFTENRVKLNIDKSLS